MLLKAVYLLAVAVGLFFFLCGYVTLLPLILMAWALYEREDKKEEPGTPDPKKNESIYRDGR